MKTIKLSLTSSSLVAGLALALLLALPAMATEIFNQTAAGTYVWGTTGYWTGGVPAGGTSDSVQFFTDHTTALANGTITISSDPATFTLNTLTLEGLGNTATAATTVSIGTAANTWTFDGTTPTINLNGLNGTKGLTHTVNPKLALNADLTINGNGTATFNLSGVISGTSRAITKSGTSTVVLKGANTYSGNTTVSAGVLNLGNVNAIQNSASVSIASSTATLQFGAAGTFATPASISIVGTGSSATVGVLHFTSTPTLNAALTLGGTTTISSFGISAAPTLGGAIGGTGPLTILARGGGATQYALWTLNNASSYSGNTVIYNNDGIFDVTVKLGVADALPTSTSLNLKAAVNLAVNSYSTLDLNGKNQTLAGLTDTGSSQSTASYTAGGRVINSGSLATLTINNSGADTYGTTAGTRQVAGTLGGTDRLGTAANNLALTKTGAGTLTLAGANTYTGDTAINGGVLNAGIAQNGTTSGPLGANGNISFGSGTLQFSSATASWDPSARIAAGTSASAVSIDPNSQTITFATALTSSQSGGLTLNDTAVTKGSLTLSVANGYTGDTTITAGTLILGASGSIASANIIVNGTYNVASVTGGYHLTTGKTLSGTGTVTGPMTVDSGATLTVAGSSGTTMGTLTVNGGLTLNGTTTLRLNKGGGTTSDKITWSSGTVTLGGTLNLSSVGTTLAAGDTFTILATGATVSSPSISPAHPNNDSSLSWDTSSLSSQGKIGVLAAITGTISAPATFSAAFTAISGTASAAQSVSVTVSSGSLSSGITATAPTGLEVSSDGISYGSTATLSATGGTLYARLSASAAAGTYNSINVVLSNPNAASVNVATTSSGNIVASAPYWAATSSGNWGTAGNWFASTIASGSGNTADFSQVDITSDTTVHLETSYTIGNLIFGNTDVSPAANWILDNNGSAGNTLTLAGGTPTVTVNNLGTGKSATISAEIDGTAGLTKAGSGTLTLSSANNAYSGGTTVSAGTLALSGSGTLGSTSGALTTSGGTLDLGGTSQTVGAVSMTGAATIQNGTLTGSSFTASVASGTATVSAALAISGNANNSGAGTLALNPGTGNTNTVSSLKTTAGGLTLSSGTLNVTATGTPAANGLWIAGGTLTVAGGTLNTSSGYATVGGGGTLAVSSGTCNINGSELLNGYGGAGTTTVNGTGVLNVNILRVTQTGSGGVVNLNGGTLQLNSFSYGAGVGTVNFNGGTVQAKTATTAFTAVNSSITYKVQAGGAIITNAVSITVGSPLVHDSGGPSLDGGLTKLGSGTLTLSNANTYTGNTTINAGNLQGVVGGSCANSTVILNASTATNGVSITDNTQSWTCGALTTAAAGVLQFNFGVTPSTTVAPLAVTGAATFTATPTVSIVGSIPTVVGDYPLMTWGSTSGTAPSVVSVATASGQLASLSNSPTTLYLVLATNPVASFPVVAAAPTNLIANGNFNQLANPVQISATTAFNLNGSHGDYSAFWSNTCDLVSWSPFAADPYGLTTNVTAFLNDPTKVLNGTYYLDTVVATNNGGITLNSSMSYLNGLIQTNVLNGVTVKSGATFLFMLDPNQSSGTANQNSTFTAALTAGAGANATNPATAVSGSLFSVATTNLPTTAGPFLTNTISGASLLAAQGSGPVNVIFDQINTTPIAGYPASPNPTDITQVAQVRIHNAILRLVVPTGDLNQDGVVDQADVNLAQSYLDGSIDGGASATNRENMLISTYGFTTNQALAYLNLTKFDINGNGYFDASDVAALQAMVVTTPPTLNYSVVAPNQIQFNWSGAFKLQWLTNTLSSGLQTNVSNGWVYYPNTNNPVTVTNHQTIPTAFFRLSQ